MIHPSVRVCCLLLFLPMVVGCAQIQSTLEGMQKPGVRVETVRLENISLKDVTLVAHTTIDNPYSVNLPLVRTKYRLSGQGRQVVSGETNLSGSVQPGGSRTVEIPVQVVYRDLLSTLQNVRPGTVVPYETFFTFVLETPAGNAEVPVSHEGKLPIPTAPSVSVNGITWKNLGLQNTTGEIEMNFGNRNEFSLGFTSFDFNLTLSGTKIAGTELGREVQLKAGGSDTVRVPISFSPVNAGYSFFQSLKGDRLSYGIEGTMQAETPYGPMSIPINTDGNATLRGK